MTATTKETPAPVALRSSLRRVELGHGLAGVVMNG